MGIPNYWRPFLRRDAPPPASGRLAGLHPLFLSGLGHISLPSAGSEFRVPSSHAIFFAALVLVAAPLFSAENEQPVEDIGTIMVAFGEHLESHPMAEAEDLYKFLHQAVYGPGHAISNRGAAAAWLERELADLGQPIEGEPACEALGGEPSMVRVNLRPFVARGGDPDKLVEAFVSSANEERGTSPRMEVVLKLGASYLGRAGRGELAPELEALAAKLGDSDYPAIHHSQAYVEAYQPAYRVVLESLAADHGWCEDD